MKNTLMFLMVSLLLAFSLTACGGGSQQESAYDSVNPAGTAGNGGINGSSDGSSNGSVTGGENSASGGGSSVMGGSASNSGSSTSGSGSSASGGTDSGLPDDSLVDGARNALDDAGRALDSAESDF